MNFLKLNLRIQVLLSNEQKKKTTIYVILNINTANSKLTYELTCVLHIK